MSKLPPIYDILDKGQKHLAKPEVVEANKKAVEEFKKKNAMPPSNQSSKGGRKTAISTKFNRCVKSVRKTVRARKGTNKESAAIGICTKSVLHKRGRTIKRYRKGRLVTQKKFRGGAGPQPEPAGQGFGLAARDAQAPEGFGLFRTSTRESVPPPPSTWESIANGMEGSIGTFGNSMNAMHDLEQKVIEELQNVSPATADDMDNVFSILSFAIQMKSKKIVEALHQRGVKKETMLMILETMLEDPENTAEFREELETLQPFVANLS